MFGMDIKSLMSGDVEGFVQQLQDAGTQGAFDPLAMFQGISQLHSVFIGPLSPQFIAARQEFLQAGSGELSVLLQQLQQSGMDAAQAQSQCRQLLEAVQGMLVCVYNNDQGIQLQTHMFFGHLDNQYLDHLQSTDQEHAQDLRGLLETLRQQLSDVDSAHGPANAGFLNAKNCYACLDADEGDTARDYWCELAESMLHGMDQGIMPGQRERLSDLAFWLCTWLPACVDVEDAEDALDGDELLVLARCSVLMPDLEMALQFTAMILEEYEPPADEMLPLLEELTDLGIRQGCGLQVELCFAHYAESMQKLFCGAYEYDIALMHFRALASAGVDATTLLLAAQRMHDADASSFRHDVNKEPLWRVSSKPQGRCLDTADAADLLDRSLTFMAKRIDNGTLPSYRQGEEVTIPEQSLLAWKRIVEHFHLLE